MAVTESVDEPRDHAGLAVLSYGECLRLAASQPVGRLAFDQDGEIEVFPVNHCVLDNTIAFRTADGSKLGASIQGSVVAFEIDDYDAGRQAGWSVLFKGRVDIVTDESVLARLRATGVRPWSNRVPRPTWVILRPDVVTGRRL
jgi:nitroimidazol reductase NimA-like FMN-containing flavoprotein (pyridoxamine 5'-phosphate oxidase superfamily)